MTTFYKICDGPGCQNLICGDARHRRRFCGSRCRFKWWKRSPKGRAAYRRERNKTHDTYISRARLARCQNVKCMNLFLPRPQNEHNGKYCSGRCRAQQRAMAHRRKPGVLELERERQAKRRQDDPEKSRAIARRSYIRHREKRLEEAKLRWKMRFGTPELHEAFLLTKILTQELRHGCEKHGKRSHPQHQ